MMSKGMRVAQRFLRVWVFVSATMLACGFSTQSRADTWCVLSNFIVDSYDHGGVYLHGTLTGGMSATFIEICGETNGVSDCTTQATDRRMALALAAQSGGHTLDLYFIGMTSCSDYQAYTRPTTIQMLN